MKVWQIYYDDHSKSKLDSGFTPYDNTGKVDKFFENSVILDVWKNKRDQWQNEDYVGVVSWRLFEKTHLTSKTILQNVGHSPVYIIDQPRYVNAKGTLNMSVVKEVAALADKDKLFSFDLCDYDRKYGNDDCVCFGNFFLVTPEIFDDYCKNYLAPAVEWLKQNDAWLNQKLPYKDSEYPVHPFFLEGLFQCFVHSRAIPYKYITDAIISSRAKKNLIEDEKIIETILN